MVEDVELMGVEVVGIVDSVDEVSVSVSDTFDVDAAEELETGPDELLATLVVVLVVTVSNWRGLKLVSRFERRENEWECWCGVRMTTRDIAIRIASTARIGMGPDERRTIEYMVAAATALQSNAVYSGGLLGARRWWNNLFKLLLNCHQLLLGVYFILAQGDYDR